MTSGRTMGVLGAVVFVGCTIKNGEDVRVPTPQRIPAGVSANCGSPMQCYDGALKALEEAQKLWDDRKQDVLTELVPIGSVIGFPSEALPPTGWLPCDGQEYQVARYQKLADLLKTIYGKAVKPGYFVVPDYQGYFLRGWDQSHLRDPSVRTPMKPDAKLGQWSVGSVEGDLVGSHTHTTTVPLGGGDPNHPEAFGKYGVDERVERHAYPSSDVVGTHEETRPKNVSIVYLIRAD